MVVLPVKKGAVNIKPSKIVAVGRNYLAHAEEMGSSVPEKPVLFLKPPSAIIGPNSTIILPSQSRRVEHEVELAVIIGKKAKNVEIDSVMNYVYGYTIILDITARDLQAEAKKKGLPWSVSKGFDTFAPIGPRIVPRDDIDPSSLHIWLKVNGELRQDGNTKDMIFSVPFLVSYISKIMTLKPGDIIATGTPAGVGPLENGDFVEAGIDGIGTLKERVKRI